MSQEAATDTDSAPTDSPLPETSPEESAASEEETPEAATKETNTGEETPDEGPAAGRSPALQKLLDKYGGDEDAMVAAYFEQANSASRLWKEMQELREDLLVAPDDDDDPEQLVAEDPDVQGLKSQRDSLQQDVEAVQQDQMAMVGAYGQLEQEIKVLEASVTKADDFEKTTLQQQISSKKSELRGIASSVNRGRRELNAIGREITRIERQQDKARRDVLGRRETQRKEAARGQRVARLARDDFNATIRAEAERFGVDPSSKQFNVLSGSVRNQLSQYLNQMPKDAPAIDIPAATKKLMGEFAEAMNLKAKFQKASDAKRTPVTSGPRASVPLPKGVNEPKMPKDIPQFGKDGKNWTPEFAKARARRMLGD